MKRKLVYLLQSQNCEVTNKSWKLSKVPKLIEISFRLGLGYKPSASAGDSFKLESMKQENDLRKRLLGKRKRQDPAALSTGSHGGSKPRPHKALQKEPPQEGSDEDEDGGRTMLGKSNRKASGTRYIEKGKMNQPGSSNMQTDGVDQQQFDVELNAKLRRPKSLLDEVLTQNAQKSSKRKDKKSKSKDMHSSHNLD